MNKQQRKQIESLVSQLETIKDELETIKDDEECKYDNLPESFQYGEKGEQMQEGIEHLDSAILSCDDVLNELQEIFEN